MRTRCLIIHVPGDLHARLESLAAREDRDVIQQARFILKNALLLPATPAAAAAPPAPAPEVPGAARG